MDSPTQPYLVAKKCGTALHFLLVHNKNLNKIRHFRRAQFKNHNKADDMVSQKKKGNEKPKTSRFKTIHAPEKQSIRQRSKAPNTHRATKLWTTCFSEYLVEKQLAPMDQLTNEELPDVLEQFYAEVCKKEKRISGQECDYPENEHSYKNTTLKAIRGALARYFKEERSIDIISGEQFIRANQLFAGVQKINKENGLGSIKSKPPITESDMQKIADYFKHCLAGPPNAKALQEITLFYIIFFLCRRGRENLRPMKKSTFSIAVDADDGRKYIYQAIDEAHKNHSQNDTSESNQGRIYEVLDNLLYNTIAVK